MGVGWLCLWERTGVRETARSCSILTPNRPHSYAAQPRLDGVIQQGTSLRRTMEQLMDEALRTPALPPPRLTADIYESVDGDAYIVEIPVPGLDATKIDVEATPEMLTVVTRPREQNSRQARRYLVQEHHQEPTSRVFQFPDEIDPDRIAATVQAGMLKIQVPKAAAGRRRVIKLTPPASESASS